MTTHADRDASEQPFTEAPCCNPAGGLTELCIGCPRHADHAHDGARCLEPVAPEPTNQQAVRICDWCGGDESKPATSAGVGCHDAPDGTHHRRVRARRTPDTSVTSHPSGARAAALAEPQDGGL